MEHIHILISKKRYKAQHLEFLGFKQFVTNNTLHNGNSKREAI